MVIPKLSDYEKKRAVNQAQKDLEKKLKLERTFHPEIKNLFNRMNNDFQITVAATGIPPNAKIYSPAWESALLNHYARVQRAFTGSVTEFDDTEDTETVDTETVDAEDTDAEDTDTEDTPPVTDRNERPILPTIEQKLFEELLALALLHYRKARAAIQSQYIERTNKNNMADSITQAKSSLAQQDLPINNVTVSKAAAAILKRKTNGRVSAIETLETQAPAESTKLMEARTVDDRRPTSTAPSEMRKTWRTIGDKKVRDAHKDADFQTKFVESDFIVMGQHLMYPGDGSLGASIGNIINCRCSTIYFKK